jgi:UrcA family protein
MKRMFVGITLALLASAAFASQAFAQQIEGVDVEASRIVKERIGTTADNLTPINSVSLSYKVSYADLDLATSAGAKALEERVKAAALAACKEITRLYPDANPGDSACAKKAATAAMVKVRELVAAAGGTPKK